MYLDPASRDMAFVYVQNPTGGVFAGDRLETRLALDVGAQSARDDAVRDEDLPDAARLARISRSTSRLASGSYLELVPDLVIPHAGSRFSQKLDVAIAPDAGFFVSEMVAPGRLARGERFEYSALDLRTRVLDDDGAELVADALLFEPALRRPDRRGLLGGFPFLGTALAVAPSCDVSELAHAIDDACSTIGDDVVAGGCPVHGDVGVAVRVLAASHRSLRDVLDVVWGVVRERLVGALPPTRRK